MASLRSIAGCIGISGNFSVARDFFGYVTGSYGHLDLAIDLQTLTKEEATIDPALRGRLSVLQQLTLLKGPHVHLDVVRVGLAGFTITNEREIDAAIQTTRELYARIGLGIGRVLRWFIADADVDGFTSIDSECEAFDLLDGFEAPGDGIDVFFVDVIATTGRGATPEKDAGGCVVELNEDYGTGIALAHEIGHFLGLGHSATSTNLMRGGEENPGFPQPPYDLTSDQIDTMKGHGMVRGGCP